MSLLVLALVSCLSVVTVLSVDVTPVIATFSSACQTTLTKYPISQDCTWDNILKDYEFVVRLGFCTENEYSNLTATRCGGNSTTYPISDAKKSFYGALNKVSSSCQQKCYDCLFTSVIAVASKQQEQFCSLMNLNIDGNTSAACLTNGQNNCTQDEFLQLQTTACKVNTTTADHYFTTALLSTSAACQTQISKCGDTSSEAWYWVLSEKYCDSLKIGGDFSAVDACFKNNSGCTTAEVESVKSAACSSGPIDLTPVIATYSQPCQTVLNYSKSTNLDKTVLCSMDSILSGYEFLVRLGFCTENEYSNLTVTLCGGQSSSYNISKARTNFYDALKNVSPNCQRRGYDCIFTSVIAVATRQQEQFCSLMNLNVNGGTSEMCLTNGPKNCTLNEFNSIKTAACSVNTTNVDQTFSKALLDTSAACQTQISICADTSSEAWILVLSEKYCDSLKIGGDFSGAETCFKQNNQCTATEVEKVKVAACGATNITTVQPTGQSTVQPTGQSTVQPTGQSTVQPTGQSTVQPTGQSTVQATVQSTTEASNMVANIKAWSLNHVLLSILSFIIYYI